MKKIKSSNKTAVDRRGTKRHIKKSMEERISYLTRLQQAATAGETEKEETVEGSISGFEVSGGEGTRHRLRRIKRLPKWLKIISLIGATLPLFFIFVACYAKLIAGIKINNDKIKETQNDVRGLYNDTIDIRERLAKIEVRAESIPKNTMLLSELNSEIEKLRNLLDETKIKATEERKVLLKTIERKINALESKIFNQLNTKK